ncbi:hypothetical protein POM88_046484 [Heracleum sosnowskyi]|uniref:Uncharacterized protein n=1 Tax=Heracleum sosnowskyi TaxID=360622 RepID=A0AAD8H934_9APIA|nr:hypothetical protein POM88_046483 [Heracleum sosnowskyi]KAK1362010.1 hypothetical protein POM88_046484 [Heracleum sosnowskyi]
MEEVETSCPTTSVEAPVHVSPPRPVEHVMEEVETSCPPTSSVEAPVHVHPPRHVLRVVEEPRHVCPSVPCNWRTYEEHKHSGGGVNFIKVRLILRSSSKPTDLVRLMVVPLCKVTSLMVLVENSTSFLKQLLICQVLRLTTMPIFNVSSNLTVEE